MTQTRKFAVVVGGMVFTGGVAITGLVIRMAHQFPVDAAALGLVTCGLIGMIAGMATMTKGGK